MPGTRRFEAIYRDLATTVKLDYRKMKKGKSDYRKMKKGKSVADLLMLLAGELPELYY
jgi:hypothetical protein